jgi:hypothetical protein
MLSPFRNPYAPTRSECRRLRSVKGRLENCLIERPGDFSLSEVRFDCRNARSYGVNHEACPEHFWYRYIFDP